MKVRNNYNECLTNLACSIRKYFNLSYKHQTLKYIDDLLDKNKPQNVIVFLFDGMGSRILDRTLDKEDFFIRNKYKDITSVFPATTTAATTSIRTGLNPIEHGWLGWNTYIKPIDKTITLFFGMEKGKEEVCDEFLKVKNKLAYKYIEDEINEKNEAYAVDFFPFKSNNVIVYKNIADMLNMVYEETKKKGKKYIYVYDDEPDHTMHDYGPDCEKVKKLIKERNDKVAKLCEKLKDSLVIIIADHGHIKVDNIFLDDYPEFMAMLDRTTSIEQRAVSFKVKDEYKDVFKDKFNLLFGKYFELYDKKDIIDSKLFGDGIPNELFEDAVGDFIAIACNSNKCLVSKGDSALYSQHAGYTDDEIYIPLIVVNKK